MTAPDPAAEAAVADALAAHRTADAEPLAAAYLAVASPVRDTTSPATDAGFRAAYLAGRVVAETGRLAVAHARLAPLAALAPRLPAGVAARLLLTLAEADGRRQRHRDALSWLDRVPASELADPLLDLRAVRVRLWAGLRVQVAQRVEDLTETFVFREDAVHLTLLLVERGRAYEAEGNLAAATALWRRSASRPHLGPGPRSGGGMGSVRAVLGR